MHLLLFLSLLHVISYFHALQLAAPSCKIADLYPIVCKLLEAISCGKFSHGYILPLFYVLLPCIGISCALVVRLPLFVIFQQISVVLLNLPLVFSVVSIQVK